MKRAILLSTLITLLGCGGSLGGLSRILFTGVSAADLDLKAVVEARCADLKSAPLGIVPEGVDVGGILPASLLGEDAPRWLLFLGAEMKKKCDDLELNSRIRFAGIPDQHGVIHVSDVDVDQR